MAVGLKDLCRLCATKEESLKDLTDENNKNIIVMIQELIQIAVSASDDLPTKVCLSCEEKMVSFQLFVYECYQVQETLKKLFVDNTLQSIPNKNEDFTNLDEVKQEVKVEYEAEDIDDGINNDSISNEFDGDQLIKSDRDSDSDGDMSDVNLATLQQEQIKKKKAMSKENEAALENILRKNEIYVKDLVKLDCTKCKKPMKSWNALRLHNNRFHQSKQNVYCICGFKIKSKSNLYKHVSDHRAESQKYKKDNDIEKVEKDTYQRLNVTNFVSFTCKICDKPNDSWYRLQTHSESEHKVKPVVQCVCGVTLKSKSVMYKHVSDHKNPNVICCDKCPRIMKTVAAMNKHKERHIPKTERKFHCQTCNKIYNTKDQLKSHARSHIPVEERKIYQCDICDLKFTTRSSAASHKRVVHDKIKGYVCDLCGYACGTGGELRQHRAIHSEDKPFVCSKCSKPFKTYANLKTHMDTHEDTSYTCYVCSRVLNSRRTLKKHLLVHEDKCRYVCSYCNKAFKRRQTLKVHMYTHTGDKPLTCKWCEERFAYASTLRSHRLRCHPDKMPLQYNSYNGHIAVQQGYLKTDEGAPAVNIGKNDVEAI